MESLDYVDGNAPEKDFAGSCFLTTAGFYGFYHAIRNASTMNPPIARLLAV